MRQNKEGGGVSSLNQDSQRQVSGFLGGSGSFSCSEKQSMNSIAISRISGKSGKSPSIHWEDSQYGSRDEQI
jgi:hypothetical protein